MVGYEYIDHGLIHRLDRHTTVPSCLDFQRKLADKTMEGISDFSWKIMKKQSDASWEPEYMFR